MVTLTATEHAISRPATEAANPSSIPAKIKWLLKHAGTAYEVSLERRQLLKLTNSELQDIGLTREQVLKESKRSFFDIPKR